MTTMRDMTPYVVGRAVPIDPGASGQDGSSRAGCSVDSSWAVTMLRIRHFELKINELFARGEVRGTAHLCVGQEAVPTGVCAALRSDDYVSATHRGHGAAIAKGLSLYGMFSEILGRRDGYGAGRGGSQHIACMEKGFLGTNGISGGGLPVSVGAALSSKRLGLGRVAVAFFGDGVANQGAFHEALNMAGIWRLPIVFVCENNLYAMSAPVSSFVAGGSIARRAESYGMRHDSIDGNDVGQVFEASRRFVDLARSGEGPGLLECLTYRQLGHSKSDKRAYRTREEEAAWLKRDPIARERRRLDGAGIMPAADFDAMESRVVAEVASEAERALACQAADVSTLYDHVVPEAAAKTCGGITCPS